MADPTSRIWNLPQSNAQGPIVVALFHHVPQAPFHSQSGLLSILDLTSCDNRAQTVG